MRGGEDTEVGRGRVEGMNCMGDRLHNWAVQNGQHLFLEYLRQQELEK